MKRTDDERTLRSATRISRAGRRPEWTGPIVNPPVWRGSTHLFETEGARRDALRANEDGEFFYGRRGSPTQWALADALTELEPRAAGTVLYPSGVAAIAGCLLTVLKPGDHLLMTDNAYEPSRSTAMGLLQRFGITHEFFDPLDTDGFAAMMERSPARGVWLESPGSLTMEVCDTPAIAAIARDHGAISMIDNTWAGPLGFAALDHGCDITMMSLSKHVGGHSDLMMGSASAGERWYRALRRTSQQLGQVVSPDDAALAARGLRTMALRLEQSTRSATRVAAWLADRPQVARVMCPMLPGDAGHEMWSRDFAGGCGLFSFALNTDDPDASAQFVDALDLFGIGYSWGGFESLALPIDPQDCRSVMAMPGGKERQKGTAVRLSIGLEDSDDLIADIEQALSRIGPAKEAE